MRSPSRITGLEHDINIPGDSLRDMGYSDVLDYRGGKEHWEEGGLSLTTETPQPVTA